MNKPYRKHCTQSIPDQEDWKVGKETKEHFSVMPFSYSNFGYKQTNKCAVAYLSQRHLSVQVWQGKFQDSWRSSFVYKKKKQKRNNPHTLSVLSFSSQLNVARAKAMPIPLCYPTPLLQNRNVQRNSFVCHLHTHVWGLGGRKGVWRTPTASLFHALHSLSHNQVFFPFLTY